MWKHEVAGRVSTPGRESIHASKQILIWYSEMLKSSLLTVAVGIQIIEHGCLWINLLLWIMSAHWDPANQYYLQIWSTILLLLRRRQSSPIFFVNMIYRAVYKQIPLFDQSWGRSWSSNSSRTGHPMILVWVAIPFPSRIWTWMTLGCRKYCNLVLGKGKFLLFSMAWMNVRSRLEDRCMNSFSMFKYNIQSRFVYPLVRILI